jgi:acetolactate synthase-1/3 small subunit
MSTTEGKKEGLHVMSALVENEFGVLARIAGLFAARGFNIESLTVGPTHDETISRMTILVKGSATVIEQVKKQLNKMIEVVTVQDLTETGAHLTRELMLIKVHCTAKNRLEIMQIGELFKAKAIDYTPGSITFEVVGGCEKLDNFITFMQPFGIAEMARSGVVGMNRGAGGLQSQFAKKAPRSEEAPKEEVEIGG